MLEARVPPAVPAVSPSWNGMCRLCAHRRGDICIFSRHCGKTSLSQQALLVASLKIVPEDGLPHVVCHACAARLSRCFMFRQRARRAQHRLRARSTHVADMAPACEPESDEGNSYTQSTPVGFSDDDREPENTPIDGHACSKSTPEAYDRNLSDSNRLSIKDHGFFNSSSKNNINNHSNKNNEIGCSENDNSRSDSSHKKDKSCSESSHKKNKRCSGSLHEKDKSCSESSNNKKDKSCLEITHNKDKSCPESSHKKDKSCTDSRNGKCKVNKSNITISKSTKSKRKSLNSENKCYSKLNKNKSTNDTAINKSALNKFLENDIDELLSDEKLNYKSEFTDNCTNYVTSNILLNALQEHSSCDSLAKQCKIEKNAEKKKDVNDIDTDVISDVISRQNKNNDVKEIVKSITKDTRDLNKVREDVISRNGLVCNDEAVKASKSCGETGDSDGAVGGDQGVSWCESDEEKLLHTALKMSIVRHSRDWEIKRETEVCDIELMDTSVLELNAMAANATHLKLKVRDDLYADSPEPPLSSDLVAEEKKVAEKRKTYQCQLCSQSFGGKSLLKKHLSTCWLQIGERKGDEKEQGENKQQNDSSSGVRVSRASRKGLRGVHKNEKTKRKKERKCKVCGDVFSGRYKLLLHRRSPCAPRAPLATAAALREHMCEVCGRTFKQRTVLLQHMSTHSGLKLFTCPLCSKTFTRGAHVHVHMRIHNNIKPFVCETCGRSFTKSSDLLRHRRVHSDARDFPCTLCHKAFKRSGDVASHMRSHTGQRPYKCEPCCKSYTNHSSLLKHRRNNCALKRPPEQTADVKPSSPESLLSNP